MGEVTVTLTVNGEQRTLTVEPRKTLADALREDCALTGTHLGCEHGVCGACTVLEDGRAVRACQVRLGDTAGKRYTTIEGLAAGATHPCQRAWIEEDVAQCGYCQPAMILATVALLHDKPTPTDADIDEALDGQVCRCGSYPRIRKAIHRAARER